MIKAKTETKRVKAWAVAEQGDDIQQIYIHRLDALRSASHVLGDKIVPCIIEYAWPPKKAEKKAAKKSTEKE